MLKRLVVAVFFPPGYLVRRVQVFFGEALVGKWLHRYRICLINYIQNFRCSTGGIRGQALPLGKEAVRRNGNH